ncbi:hypothetical protein GBF38_020141, partial [Nibea albiflora]
LCVWLWSVFSRSDRSVSLEFPNPAIAGSDVTLRCKTRDSSTYVWYFFRNGSFFGHTQTGEFTINNVQHSDEDPDAPPMLLVRLLCHLVVVCLYFISTILMVSIYCSKRKGNNTAIAMEIDSRVEGGQGRSVDHDYVTTVHNF